MTGHEKYKTLTLRGGNRAAAAELARFSRRYLAVAMALVTRRWPS